MKKKQKEKEECRHCEGTGWVTTIYGSGCGGADTDKCYYCKGTKLVDKSRNKHKPMYTVLSSSGGRGSWN